MSNLRILTILILGYLALATETSNAERPANAPKPATLKTAATPSADMNSLERQFYQATAGLYVQEMDGGDKFLCTVTAFEKKGDMTHFVSAAHCASEDNTVHGRVNVSKDDFFIRFDDDPEKKITFAAKIIGAGYQHRGDDFLVVEAKPDREVIVIPLADNDPSIGELISNVASPAGFGKQLFRGSISLEKLQRALIEGDINWKGATLIQTMVGPGSSGSAVVSLRQNGIVAFIVGMTRDSPSVVAIPVSRFKVFWADVQAGKYKYYNPKTPDGDEMDVDNLSAEKLVKQINSHYPGREELHLPLPDQKNKVDL